MKKDARERNEKNGLTRRRFIQLGSAAVAGSTLSFTACQNDGEGKIKEYRRLGRTGFKVSDIAIGGSGIKTEVVRYAYDKGINYIDTGESYGRGRAESQIGGAMPFIDRKKVWITTKLNINMETTEEEILERCGKCLERLKTEYVDALSLHSPNRAELIGHEGFHSAIEKLKADGRVRYTGISCHGPRGREGDSMEKVLTAAAEDGRFDLMLLVYNFMNKDAAERVLAACKQKNIGTTAMKSSPGIIQVDTFDPDNPTDQQAQWMKSLIEERGQTREQAIQRIQRMLDRQMSTAEETRPFAEQYGITTNEQLRKVSLQWVLNNPDMHTVCMSMVTFEDVDQFVPLSGTKVDHVALDALHDFEVAYNGLYCRHGCNTCVEKCAYHLPVSTIMRYSYYFEMQGRQKYAMSKYAELKDQNGARCLTCDADCKGACPHGVNIQANVLAAHALLSLA